MNSNLMTSSLSNKKCVVPNLAEENFESDWVFLTEHSALMKAFSAGKEKKILQISGKVCDPIFHSINLMHKIFPLPGPLFGGRKWP